MNRRFFVKSTAMASGGFILGFNWLVSCKQDAKNLDDLAFGPFTELNGYIKIDANGHVTIMSPNPEGGQNVKTSMPMIVADELDVAWTQVTVEQAPLDTKLYQRQFIGGSQAIRQSWDTLRMAGATARQMILLAAANAWQVPVEEITTSEGMVIHKSSNRTASYGEFVEEASKVAVPEEVKLKNVEDFTIIGSSQKNVETKNIVMGKPLYGIDIHKEKMLIAMIIHPPAFGLKLVDFDASEVLGMPGIKDIYPVKTYNDEYVWQYFDTCTFMDVVAIVGQSTWEVLQAKKKLESVIKWEVAPEKTVVRDRFGTQQELFFPSGLENTTDHTDKMLKMSSKNGNLQRKDGNPEHYFKSAFKIVEKAYTAPFLAHNCMEPMNFFAHVTEDVAHFEGPLQKPEYTEKTLSDRLGIPLEKIDIKMTRLGGGYGRRSYAHWLVEAGIISQRMKVPIKLIYSREDDMSSGIYRPAYRATYRAALDDNNKLLALHVNAGGIPESPLYADRFPAGTLDHYLAEDWEISSNLTVGSFRAPRSNFMASAEQSFLDELAEKLGKDPIDFRLELLQRAMEKPVGENNDYEAERYAGVLELVRKMSGWDTQKQDVHRGVAAYFCHNTYVAQVLELRMVDGQPKIEKVYCAVDCGIVVNPDAAINLIEGAVVDGIGNALFGNLTIREGVLEQQNFDRYRMIRMLEAPKTVEVQFIENNMHPTGLGEPAFPPVMAALANALYKATGKRYYEQPFG